MVLTMKTLNGAFESCRSAVDGGVVAQPTRGLANLPALVAGEE